VGSGGNNFNYFAESPIHVSIFTKNVIHSLLYCNKCQNAFVVTNNIHNIGSGGLHILLLVAWCSW